jgi:hypothetical protein
LSIALLVLEFPSEKSLEALVRTVEQAPLPSKTNS